MTDTIDLILKNYLEFNQYIDLLIDYTIAPNML